MKKIIKNITKKQWAIIIINIIALPIIIWLIQNSTSAIISEKVMLELLGNEPLATTAIDGIHKTIRMFTAHIILDLVLYLFFIMLSIILFLKIKKHKIDEKKEVSQTTLE